MSINNPNEQLYLAEQSKHMLTEEEFKQTDVGKRYFDILDNYMRDVKIKDNVELEDEVWHLIEKNNAMVTEVGETQEENKFSDLEMLADIEQNTKEGRAYAEYRRQHTGEKRDFQQAA